MENALLNRKNWWTLFMCSLVFGFLCLLLALDDYDIPRREELIELKFQGPITAIVDEARFRNTSIKSLVFPAGDNYDVNYDQGSPGFEQLPAYLQQNANFTALVYKTHGVYLFEIGGEDAFPPLLISYDDVAREKRAGVPTKAGLSALGLVAAAVLFSLRKKFQITF